MALTGTIKTPEQEAAEREQLAQQRARMSPDEQLRYAQAVGADMAGRGIGQALGGMLGVDTRTAGEKRAGAVEKAKAEVQAAGVDPADTNAFYSAVVQALLRSGLVDEAMQVRKEWEVARLQGRRLDVQEKTAEGKQAVAEYNAATARQRAERMGPEFMQLLDAWQAAVEEGDTQRAQAITARLNFLSTQKGGTAAGVKLLDAGDRVQVLDAQGNVLREVVKGAKPLSEKDKATETRKSEAQERMKQAAVSGATRLITAVDDAMELVTTMNTGPQGRAQALVPGTPAYRLNERLETVRANVGFKELSDMRAASPTGGALGQVTERELKFLQSVLGSLELGVGAPELRKNLMRIRDSAEKVAQDNGGSAAPAAPAAPAEKPAATEKKRLKFNPSTGKFE